jgi:large repetitive protein
VSTTLAAVTLAPGASQTQTLAVPLTATGATVTAVVGASSVPDSNPANNTVTVTINTSATDLSIQLTVPPTASPGATVTGVATVTNLGSNAAQNVTISFVLPNGFTQTFAVTGGALSAGGTVSQSVTYVVPPAQVNAMTWTATVATTTPETITTNNIAAGTTTVTPVNNAQVSGRAWFDADRNRTYSAGSEDRPLAGFRVELVQGTTVVGTATTDANGQYLIENQRPGPGYSVQFRDPQNNLIQGTPFNQRTNTLLGNPSTGTNSLTSAVTPGASLPVSGTISNVTLYAGDNVIEQNLPLDPNGIVYDSIARTPVAGATVRLLGPLGFDPTIHLVAGAGGARGDVVVTGPSGFYDFLFIGTPPAGVYRLEVTPPAGYNNTPAVLGGVVQPQALAVPASTIDVQPQNAAPQGGANTTYYLTLTYAVSPINSGEVLNNHIPLDPQVGQLVVTKTGNKTVAEVGDAVQYTIGIRNITGFAVPGVTLVDRLPAGFRYIAGTARLAGVSVPDPAGGVGPELTFTVGAVAGGANISLTYAVRLAIGSEQGDGINRATAVYAGGRSNTAQFKVNVQGGIFSNEGCIIGKVYVDCDGTHVQNNESGSRELGIPGVRLVMLDGSYVITDSEGKYSLCGVKPQTHVIKIDRTTLPRGSRMLPSSNRNAGVGDSIFVDMKGGELHRADFIEGSCSPEVLDQVKARRAQGGVLAPETENIKPLEIQNRRSFEGNPIQPQQILPAPRPLAPTTPAQPLEGVRQ